MLHSTPGSQQLRQLQTRRFDGVSERNLLSASAGVLQDLGFNIDGSSSRLGLITASKVRKTWEDTEWWKVFLGNPTDSIRLSLVTRPASGTDPNVIFVRVTIQLTTRDNNNQQVWSGALEDPAVYQGFFDKLSQSLFLEAHQI